MISLFAILIISPAIAISQTGEFEESFESDVIPGGIIPDDDTIGPVANTGAEYKFDDGFYQKIQELINTEPIDGDYGVYDGERYYDVLIVVSRDDGDDRTPDETAKENKDAVVKRLNILGAKNIFAAESLSFVTASIPVSDVPGFSLHDAVYALGDGEIVITPEVDTARQTIHATDDEISQAVGRSLNGSDVRVAVVDTGINNIYLNDKVIDRIYCKDGTCREQPADIIIGQNPDWPNSGPEYGTQWASHGTQVAQVLAASGMSANNGTAPEVELLDAMYDKEDTLGNFRVGLAHALDWSHAKGADVANLSGGHSFCTDFYTNTYNLIVNEAVDKGMFFVKSVGNNGFSNIISQPHYQSISNPGCAHNAVTVGGINDRDTPLTMYTNSSRGPTIDSTPRLVPHIVAPAHQIEILDFPTNDNTNPGSGTSYAAPQVSATAAMMLQLVPELTPVEIKATLLLGADWQGPIPCNSVQYEQNNPNDNCSYARQPIDHNTANNAASLGILNNVGFGILDTTQTLEYTSSSENYVIGDYLDTHTSLKQYAFVITDTSEPVKVILTWLVHPHGDITEQLPRYDTSPVANLDFTIRTPSNGVIRADSDHQTAEFAVFEPTRTGTYTITVTGTGLDSLNKPIQNFALASTNPLTVATEPTNTPPIANSNTITINPHSADPAIIRLTGTDVNNDPISFSMSEPTHGTISTDELITKTSSRALYTPDAGFTRDTFTITPHDGLIAGTPATITIQAESSLPGSEINPTTSNIRDWDTLEVTSGYINTEYSKTFPGKNYPVSAIYMGSVNMEGVELNLATSAGTFQIAVPPSGVRMIEFTSPLTIISATISADGIDEETAHKINRQIDDHGILYPLFDLFYPLDDVRMFVGYVPSSCSAGGASGASDSCPASVIDKITAQANIAIPDNTKAQDTSSTIYVPTNGTISDIKVTVNITHTWKGDLKVILTSPDGTEITLHDRSGGSADNIMSTWSSTSNTELAALAGSYSAGDWTISVGDYAGGDVGVLETWDIEITRAISGKVIIPPSSDNPILFFDSFDDLDNWTETGEGDWTISTTRAHSVPSVPDTDPTNNVLHSDDCDSSCTVTLTDSIDLTQYDSAVLSFWRFIDYGLDRDEYLKVEMYNGYNWSTIYHWSPNLNDADDNMWHQEQYNLSEYLDTSNFKIRFVTQQSVSNEDVQIDDLTITVGGTATIIPDNPTSISEDFESGLDSWTQNGDSDWIVRAPITTVPDSSSNNMVAYSVDCDSLCIMTMNPVDLSELDSGYLKLDRYVSSELDSGEYLKVEVYDGSVWSTAFDWQASAREDDSTWHTEYFDLSSHLVSDMQIKITAKTSYPPEVTMIDNISITDSVPSVTTLSEFSIYVADSDDREVLVYSSDGTFVDDVIPRRAGGLGKVWDVAFGPDGNIYAADLSYNKIRKYSSTGASLGLSSSNAEWASTVGFPTALEWRNNILYVATGYGIERFSTSGTALGFFGDATRDPPNSQAPSLLTPYGLVFCSDGRLYVADRGSDKIFYYSASTGSYLGTISGTNSSPPNTFEAAGIQCGPAMTGSGTNIYQSGDDNGRVNEITTSGTLVREITSSIDEPYGMDMDSAGNLYVANKDDDNILKITNGIPTALISGGLDDPRGVTVGPPYLASGASGQTQPDEQDNETPEFTANYSPVYLSVNGTSTFTISATDEDGDVITFDTIQDSMPDGTFALTDYGNGTATVSIDMTTVPQGSYVFWLTISDGIDTEHEPYGVIIS